MDHTPFIAGAYSAATIILLWCALAPVARYRKLTALLRTRAAQENKDPGDASQT